MRTNGSVYSSWVWKIAWRDSRSTRRRLLLAMASSIIGIAALVAITSFSENLEEAVHNQSKTLLGADFALKSRRPFTEETEELIRTIGGEQSRRVSFSSMVYFPKNSATRLARIWALEGQFPYYGVLETVPDTAAQSFKRGPYALVDDSLMLQFDAQVGDTIKIGAFIFRIAGRLKKIPGRTLAVSLVRPRILIPKAYLKQTQLIRTGSVARYRVYFKFAPGFDLESLIQKITPHATEHRLEIDTVEKRRARIGWSMENLSRYLILVGFIAVLLGGLGIASGIHVYVRKKIETVAILRCLGAKGKQTLTVYLIQATAMGLIASCLGALIGIGIQRLLPAVLADFLPLKVTVSYSFSTILLAIGMGLAISMLFALLPLLSLRRISPLLALRSSYEDAVRKSRDPLQWFIYLLIVTAVGWFSITQSDRWQQGTIFAAGIVSAFALLAAVAKLIMTLVKRYFPVSWPYVWRQGLANLYRPGNQTTVLMLSVGLGTFLILTLYLSQEMLLKQVSFASQGNQPNMVLFDVQPDQREDITDLLRSFGLRTYQQVPIVTMRLAAIKNKKVEDIRHDPNSKISNWAIRREYRSTYRDHLIDTETLLAGTWQGNSEHSSEIIPISLEKGIAKRLNVAVGDKLVFDIHGVPVSTRVGSIREVDWHRVQPNFFVVFPVGVLESVPQFYVLVTRVASKEISADLQRTVVQIFPNISTIDLTFILDVVDAILSKVAFAIQFRASFSIVTALIVLGGAVITSRSQRLMESALLRTLGASRKQILKIMAIEYLFLGGLAALSGIILAVAASWALAYYYFSANFVPPLLIPLTALLLVTAVTILAGMLGSQGIYNRPALELLRADG